MDTVEKLEECGTVGGETTERLAILSARVSVR